MEILRETFRSLKANKLRTFLSMLGIIIGVTAVITIVSLGQGSTEAINKEFASLGSNIMTIEPGYGQKYGGWGPVIDNLKASDVKMLNEMTNSLEAIIPVKEKWAKVKYNGEGNRSFNISAVKEDYFSVMDLKIKAGREFESEDYFEEAKNVIIGSRTAQTLFKNENPIGKTVDIILQSGEKIRKVSYNVVGVTESKSAGYMFNFDSAVFVPWKSAIVRIFPESEKIDKIIGIVKTGVDSKKAIYETEFIMHTLYTEPDSYRITSMDSILESMNKVTGIISFILTAIAAISLVVGGIGIMNIMLVSVSERTREIGIKMALGASKNRILLEFIVESVIITFVAGAFVMLFGYLISKGIVMLTPPDMQLAAKMTFNSVIMAFGISTGIGLFFGIYPAKRAAKLSPIEALRYE